MRTAPLIGAAMLATLPASAQQMTPRIELITGHPIYDETMQQAGVAMALAITPDRDHRPDLIALCEELRVAAALDDENDEHLRLETIFVVPRKAMAIEGIYWPRDGSLEEHALLRGGDVARTTLDSIVARAGIPPRVLDETQVEHEVSCSTIEPLWNVAWQDVQPIGDGDPDTVIERARQRFMAIHQNVVEHGAKHHSMQQALRTPQGG